MRTYSYTVKRIGEMETAFGAGMRLCAGRARSDLVAIQVEEFPPDFDQHAEHSHSEDGHGAVYVVLRGSAQIEIDAERIPLDSETIVRVGPGARKRIFPAPLGGRILALGAVPGTAYQPPASARSAGKPARPVIDPAGR